MTAIRLLAAGSLLISVWAQSGIHVERPGKQGRIKDRSRLSGVRVPSEILKIKEPCRLRLIASADELFEAGKADFADSAQRVLSELGPLLRKQEIHPIEIEGHSDSVGDPKQNRQLSERRAHAVEQWLTSHDFLTSDSAKVHGFGKTRPVAPELKADGSDDPIARQKNRRVEVVVTTCR